VHTCTPSVHVRTSASCTPAISISIVHTCHHAHLCHQHRATSHRAHHQHRANISIVTRHTANISSTPANISEHQHRAHHHHHTNISIVTQQHRAHLPSSSCTPANISSVHTCISIVHRAPANISIAQTCQRTSASCSPARVSGFGFRV